MVDRTPSELSRSLYEIHMACGIDPAKAVETIHVIVGNNIDYAVIVKAAIQQIDTLQRKRVRALTKALDAKTISEQATRARLPSSKRCNKSWLDAEKVSQIMQSLGKTLND